MMALIGTMHFKGGFLQQLSTPSELMIPQNSLSYIQNDFPGKGVDQEIYYVFIPCLRDDGNLCTWYEEDVTASCNRVSFYGLGY